jgi:sirohydrochlorin cobaltochelatase
MNAVVLLGHGSRAPGVSERMNDLTAALARTLPSIAVRAAHRELCEPALESVVEELVMSGVRKIVILPFFLHFALHMQEDIPNQLEALRGTYPDVELVLAEHLGFDERRIPILRDRLRTAMGQGT